MRNLAEHRREIALKALGTTLVKRNVSLVSLVIFSATLLSVPICQLVSDLQRGESPHVFRAIGLLPVPNLTAIKQYEDTLEEESVLTDWLLPGVQTVLTRVFRTGNEQAYLGRDGWLFYRADVDSLIGAGPQKTASAALTTLIDFNRQLEARGITLIVVPTPVKPTIHPEKFSGRYRNTNAPIHNPDYAAFIDGLRSEGVLVYDPSQLLFEAARQETQYLKTDTHWKPKAMEQVAQYLSAFITEQIELSTDPSTTYVKTAEDTVNIGDIAKMLKLAENQMLFPSERVTRHVVQTPSGNLWRPDQESEILFLGDSFSNIYSLAGMGWGASAGFVEHLSAELARPIDKIVINAGGADATRQALVQELNRGHDRLTGKRVLIYQFATREVFSGDWKLLSIPSDKALQRSAMSIAETITVTATIKAKTEPPMPRTVPYAECIIALHLENVDTSDLPETFVVFLWGMRENQWTDAATFKVDQKVKLRLRPWNSVEAVYGSYNRKELENEETWLLDVYWGEMP
ncbi:hypothetical protein C6499_20440 [Candidatus Poribacteria bacterium]|nr:MAG: hypothetical protein C6499_20440 [Candidatus Poribacteria bacterium]